jgi:D-beta-D-heptose 7-phosphate kinase/D-beta-D-heptose 1-phosphate adenosyltransferase
MYLYKDIITKFPGKKILVVGDLILDQHVRGSVSRISPEAPVPIVLQEEDPFFAPGGAANVASNLENLGAKVTLVGRIGPDLEGRLLLKELQKKSIHTEGIFVDPSMPTILKTRIIAQHQQVLRIDRERIISSSEGDVLDKARNFFEKKVRGFDGIIISDYGKGMISRELIEHLCRLTLSLGKILTVDPKVENFAYYRGVTAITPNQKEAENAIRDLKITQNGGRRLSISSDRLRSLEDVERAGRQLLKFLALESLLITLGEQGIFLFEKGKRPHHIPTKAQDVFDVTGAGDTVISVFTLALTSGATKFQAADLANFAAGIVVGKMGAVAVSREELLEATRHKSH